MGIPNVMNTGKSGMMAAKSAISTSSHNISNANTEGYSRQRVEVTTQTPEKGPGTSGFFGRGVTINRVERLNDQYLQRQLDTSHRELGGLEEKDVLLKRLEDTFNELSGDGLNRLMSRFFNEFRKLANDPNSEAVRESVREASHAMILDFKRIRGEVNEIRKHIDSKIAGNINELNAACEDIRDLNLRIMVAEQGGREANDLKDRRDLLVQKISSMFDVQTYPDEKGNILINIKGVGPLISSGKTERFGVERTKANDTGKQENSVDITSSASVSQNITQLIKGGRLGALVQVRDETLSTIGSRLDELAFEVSQAVNAVHATGVARDGSTGILFFNQLQSKERAAELLDLSDAIKSNVSNIAAAAEANSPGDNRVALNIASLQDRRILNSGRVTADDFFNSMVGEIGISQGKNREALNQQTSITKQLEKVRDQLSGVSIDEEMANLMQFQQSFDASARVIQVADHMLEEILNIGRR